MPIIYNKKDIAKKVKEISSQIERDYENLPRDEELVFIGVLKGAFIFMADLTREINIPHVVDFVSIGSYGKNGSVQGSVKILLDTRHDVSGSHVILVEDIIDSGKTLNSLLEMFKAKNTKSLRVCSLLARENSNSINKIDYLGFTIPENKWAVGYGLDYKEKMRTLSDIIFLNH